MIYLKRERKYYYNGMRLVVLPGVFHPGLFFSTKFMLEYLKTLDLKDKHVFELGAGAGMLAINCAKQKAIVTASDISWKAIINLDKNTRWNRVAVTIIQSDLFSNIPQQQFDYIIITPPYYKRNPKTEAEQAWYCGKNMEYFVRLFKQLGEYMNLQSTALMILSEDCDINSIKQMAQENKFKFNLHTTKNNYLKKNYIYSIKTT